ncbi:MAG: 50S ribosomal protein L6, partial [bacterium]|nr:50S ribosomal protein L6 [bacterium]
MSRIGKQPVVIPSGVTVELKGNELTVKGPKGSLTKDLHPNMKIEIKDDEILVKRPDESKENRSFHGLTRSLVANMVEGVSKGFEKRLEIVGVGYKAQPAKNKITLNLGFSHPIEYTAAQEIEF